MKSKLAVLFVVFLCVALLVFTNQACKTSKTEDQTQTEEPALTEEQKLKENLNQKIDEIESVLLMLHELDDNVIARGHFQKLRAVNHLVMQKAIADPSSAKELINDPNEMVNYWMSDELKGKQISFEHTSSPPIPLEEKDSICSRDKKSDIKIVFKYSGSPEYTGEMTLELFHMKRCIWD